MRRIAILLTLAALLLLAGRALAMSSEHYRLDWFTPLTGSGGAANSAHYAVNFTVGQSVIGSFSGTNYSGCLGYWCGAAAQYRVYLPLVLRSYTPPASWTTIISENFEGSFPGVWNVFDNNGNSYGVYTWGKRTCRPYAGSYSGWGVGGGTNGAALSCGSNYPDNADSWMVYGPFSLVGATAGDLSYKLWLHTEGGGNEGVIRLASINGTNFYGTFTSGNSGGWIDRTLDLTAVPTLGNLMGQPNVWVALRFYSNGSTNYAEGSYVDNIVLRKCMSSSCAGLSSASPDTVNSEIVEFPIAVTLPK